MFNVGQPFVGITLILRFFRIATIGLNFAWNQES